MANLPSYPDSNGDTGDDTGTPRWVKVFGVIVIVLVLLVVIMILAGGGGPGGHAPPEGGH